MRKRVMVLDDLNTGLPKVTLDLIGEAVVELTSEDPAYPIEAALGPPGGIGWRAGNSGLQRIRFLFDEPQTIRNVSLIFEENEKVRTQEFLLRWSDDNGGSFREIVRQQWNFNPSGSKREFEEYRVELSGVTVFELTIVPNISGGEERASLKSLRLS